MEYHYVALEKFFNSIAEDMSEENMRTQLLSLTSDEVRKLKELMNICGYSYNHEVSK